MCCKPMMADGKRGSSSSAPKNVGGERPFPPCVNDRSELLSLNFSVSAYFHTHMQKPAPSLMHI